uniref:Uncharacterized protein n=1 Tax=Haemonchus contortus TaxID=6289 RepID=A0A7I4Z1J3_HAECO
MGKVICDFYSHLFDSHVYLPTHHLGQDEYTAPSALPSEIRDAITPAKKCTAPGPDGIKPEHLKSPPPAISRTLARLFTRYLSEYKVPTSLEIRKTVLLCRKGDPDDIGNYRPISPLSVILDEGQPCEQAESRIRFSTSDHIHPLTRHIEVSREYKMPLCHISVFMLTQ